MAYSHTLLRTAWVADATHDEEPLVDLNFAVQAMVSTYLSQSQLINNPSTGPDSVRYAQLNTSMALGIPRFPRRVGNSTDFSFNGSDDLTDNEATWFIYLILKHVFRPGFFPIPVLSTVEDGISLGLREYIIDEICLVINRYRERGAMGGNIPLSTRLRLFLKIITVVASQNSPESRTLMYLLARDLNSDTLTQYVRDKAMAVSTHGLEDLTRLTIANVLDTTVTEVAVEALLLIDLVTEQ